LTITALDMSTQDEDGNFVFWQRESHCRECGELMLGEAHSGFLFVSHPNDLDVPYNYNCNYPGKSEWRPEPEYPDAFCDEGPHRVAYYLEEKPIVMLFDGPNAHWTWTPCSVYPIILDGCRYWNWICRRRVEDPCDPEYLKEISTC
jgi:hypothetical protein